MSTRKYDNKKMIKVYKKKNLKVNDKITRKMTNLQVYNLFMVYQ